MGLFAVLNLPDKKKFEVSICHLNLWVLESIFRHNIFYWDVGLRLNATEENISAFQLALPFSTNAKKPLDLRDRVLDRKVAELIFGQPVKIDNDQIDYSPDPENRPDPVQVIPIPDTSDYEAGQSGSGFSLWTIKLDPVIPLGKDAYLRLRFKVSRWGRAWTWKRSLFAKNGALVDIRVSDIRETPGITNAASLKQRIITIQTLYLFVIVSSAFQMRTSSPTVRSMRLLEGKPWAKYVESSSSWLNRKMVVYSWKNKDDKAITTIDPFRAFLDLDRQFGVTSWRDHLRTAIIVCFVFWIGIWIKPNLDSFSFDFAGIWSKWKIAILGIGGYNAIKLTFRWLSSFSEKWKKLHGTLNSIRDFHDRGHLLLLKAINNLKK